jgi:endonuclease/exonuclease/phosphatase family metal-dependent hydrolase
MHLRLYQYKNADNYLGKIKRLISMLKYGAEARSSQIDKLIDHTNSSPFPYFVCGDFNETPYSYNYFKLRHHFSNAFEEAGNGFGFTLNSIIFYLRIDHQFYHQDIEALDFRVDRSMKISDHFPTRGFYQVRNN